MKKLISITEIVRNFSDYVSRVAYRGESFAIRKGRNVMAELRPLPQGRRLAELPELLNSLPALTTVERRSFARDVSGAGRKLGKNERNPWES